MCDFIHLESLRNQNKNLLNKLKVKQGLLQKINKEAVLGEVKRHEKISLPNTSAKRSSCWEQRNASCNKEQHVILNMEKEPFHVTFHQEQESSRSNVLTGQPLLGYDWIAGLLDIDCSVAEKSQQYFSELQEFRQVNKEECIHKEYLEAEEMDLSVPFPKQSDTHAESSTEGHYCVHRYRINSRLFPVPLEVDASCPVCRTPQAKVSTANQPAYIRVSIPRATLLPPYKHKVHRRKSFDPTDSLALPSHCLAGWENAVPSSLPPPSSLDLQSSLEQDKRVTFHSRVDLNTTASRVMGNTTSDELFDLSRLARYRLQKLDQHQRWSSRMPHSTSLPVH